MTDYTELKRAAEAAAQGHWNQDGFEVQNDDIKDYRVARCNRLTDAKFIAAASPAAVLALIAENERLGNNRDMWRGQCDRQSEMLRLAHELDAQLRAEVAGLRTGYEAYEQVNAELKAEVERSEQHRNDQQDSIVALRTELASLRKDAGRFAYIERDADSGMSKIYGDDWVAVIDAALGQGEQS